MEIRLGEGQIAARKEDARLIGEITADGFRNDPFNLWLFGNFPGIRALFLSQAQRIYVPRGFCYRLGELGACMWMLPGQDSSFRLGDYASVCWSTLIRSGPRAVVRAIKTGQSMDAHHPRFPHAYLFSIALRPEAQGKGRGRKLIAPVLEACDREQIPAYLENSNPANHGFYTSCGFRPLGDIRPVASSPPLVAMLREPRG